MVADDQNTATHDFVCGSYRGGARVAWLGISGETLARDASGESLLDMNFDALVPIGDPEEVEVWGAKGTTFCSSVEGTARTFGLTIRSPGSRVLYGSERFNLARAGSPLFRFQKV